jgi:hypothetical protein
MSKHVDVGMVEVSRQQIVYGHLEGFDIVEDRNTVMIEL